MPAALIACLVLSACGASERAADRRNLPTQEELSEEIAGYADVAFNFDQVRAVVVATRDEIVLEEYFESDPDDYWDVQSVTKSVSRR